MPIQVGDKIPSVSLLEYTPTDTVNIAELCANKKVVLIGVPGAFTPNCSKNHLPAYVEKADELKNAGIGEIVCVAVNDPFVMEAWAKYLKATGKIRMLSDPQAEFAKAIDLVLEVPFLGGVRSKRYSMVIENGEVKQINVEPDGIGVTCSLPSKLKV